MSRRLRALAAALLALVAGGTLLGGPARAQVVVPPASDSGGAATGSADAAQVETELAGYAGRAITSGLHAFYNPEGLLPLGALVDIGAPDALATISAGPTTFARASVADPGDILANPEALLVQADPRYPAGTVPAYPYRVTASSSLGEPRAESNPAPGLNALVESRPDSSRAKASAPAALAPGVLSLGSLTSEATTKLEPTAVTVRARTELSGFSLLDVLKIESIVTDVTATSDGGETKLSGGTTITGATFMDQPVIIDAEGIRTAPDAEPQVPGLGAVLGPLRGSAQEVLARAGIKVSVLGPVQQAGGGEGQLSSTGLRIDLEVSEATFPVLTQLVDLVPPVENPAPGAPGVADVLQVLKAKHVVALELGRAQVSLTARKATPIDESAFGADGGSFDAGPPSSFADLATSFGTTPGATGSQPSAVPGGPALSEATPIGSVGAGVGALALLALLAQPLLGARLARAATAVLGTAGTDDHCFLEER